MTTTNPGKQRDPFSDVDEIETICSGGKPNEATGQRQRLTYFHRDLIQNLSISPSGRHIVFELHDSVGEPYRSDLWIMDRLNPVEIWPITNSGKCTTPNWSRRDVTISDAPGNGNTPAGGNTPGNASNTGSGGGGGGGGCFIVISR